MGICRSTDIRNPLAPAIDSGGVMQQESSDLGSSPSIEQLSQGRKEGMSESICGKGRTWTPSGQDAPLLHPGDLTYLRRGIKDSVGQHRHLHASTNRRAPNNREACGHQTPNQQARHADAASPCAVAYASWFACAFHVKQPCGRQYGRDGRRPLGSHDLCMVRKLSAPALL